MKKLTPLSFLLARVEGGRAKLAAVFFLFTQFNNHKPRDVPFNTQARAKNTLRVRRAGASKS